MKKKINDLLLDKKNKMLRVDVVVDRKFIVPEWFCKYITFDEMSILLSKILYTNDEFPVENIEHFLKNMIPFLSKSNISRIIDVLIIQNNRFEFSHVFNPKVISKKYTKYWSDHFMLYNSKNTVPKIVICSIIKSYIDKDITVPIDILKLYIKIMSVNKFGFLNIMKLHDVILELLYKFISKIDLIYPPLYMNKVYRLTLSNNFDLRWYWSHGGTIYINPKKDALLAIDYIRLTSKCELIEDIKTIMEHSNEDIKHMYSKVVTESLNENANKMFYVNWALDDYTRKAVSSSLSLSKIPLYDFNLYLNIMISASDNARKSFIERGGNLRSLIVNEYCINKELLIYFLTTKDTSDIKVLLHNTRMRDYIYSNFNMLSLSPDMILKITTAICSDRTLYHSIPYHIYNRLFSREIIDIKMLIVKYPQIASIIPEEYDRLDIIDMFKINRECSRFIPVNRLDDRILEDIMSGDNYVELNTESSKIFVGSNESLMKNIAYLHNGYLLDMGSIIERNAIINNYI